MGIVYLAREVALERLVAIKLLPPDLAAQAPLRERFLREARTAAQLSQPNIVPIHAVDVAGGYVYFVMAYIEGETLGERVRARGPFPPDVAGRILREIAWALAYAHGQGVIHRDLKPDNIIIERGTGRAVLTDFGIARRLETTGLTVGGELIGTPEYMSPEQATGGALDGRTDLYSLGVVGFYALSGRLPFEAATVPAILIQHASTMPPPIGPLAPAAPRALAQAVMRCLEKAPEDRYADAKEFADALSTALEARREVPAPVRAFVKSSLEIKTSGCLYIAAGLWLAPSLFMPLALSLGFARGILVSYLLYLLVFFIGIPSAAHLYRIRRLLRAGYGVEDVLAGARAEMDQKKEELAVTVGREPSRLERILPRIGWAALAASLLGVGLGVVRWLPSRTPGLAFVGIAAGFGIWMVGMAVGRRRRDILGERRIKYWSSRFGRWLFRIAGIGLDVRTAGAGATHRPTELALAFAAEDLYAELPKELQAALPGLPEVLVRLERQASAVRRRIEGLEESLADTRQDISHGAAGVKRAALLADLTTARDAARARLSESVAALETIRLDLLRLRAGAGSVDRITADLAAVGDIGASVDRLLAAGDEIDNALK